MFNKKKYFFYTLFKKPKEISKNSIISDIDKVATLVQNNNIQLINEQQKKMETVYMKCVLSSFIKCQFFPGLPVMLFSTHYNF